MTIKQDPEGYEIRALSDLVDLRGKKVLEIGCGDGRLTWRYAGETAQVVGIDPYEASIKRAREEMPSALQDKVELHHIVFNDFAPQSESESFDVVILSWSL